MAKNSKKKISSEEAILKLLNDWKERPLLYLNKGLGINEVWRLQAQMMEACPQAIAEHKPIYVASGHSLGKDYISAAIALWFLDCFSPSIVILTAPTDRQVKKIMWGETLSKWNNRPLKLWGKAYATPYIEIQKENWYLMGFTTKETGASSESGGGKFQGFHSPNICVIVSEAQAVEDNIYDQIDAITTTENVLVIYIGNPTRSRGRFAMGLKDKEKNIVFNFSCLENPNYIHQKTVIPGLASYEWVEDKRVRWGEDDPRWISRVLGQIPENATNNVFPEWLIKHMKSRFGFLAMSNPHAGVSVDPAGEGVDDNVIMAGQSGDMLNVFKKTLMSPTEIAHLAIKMCKEIDGDFIILDCDGVGIGPYQELIRMDSSYTQGINIVKFHGSAQSETKEKDRKIYENMRSEAAFITQKRAKEGRASIDPKNIELVEDLMEEEYFTNKKGLIQIEPKEDIKERLKRSPGLGDAYKMLQYGFEKGFKRRPVHEQPHGVRFGYPRESISEYNILEH